MNDVNTLLIAAVAAACAAGGVGVTFLVLRSSHRRQVDALNSRLEKIDRVRTQTNGLLVQAKKQIEGLQKDLDDLRRAKRREERRSGRSAEPAAAVPSPTEGVAEARARLDQMLDAPSAALESSWADSSTARGFAETQPLSGFGPTQPPPQQRARAA